jgi:DNA-binding Lrp family transcriptional regulator
LFDKKNVEAYMLIVAEHGAEHDVLADLMKFEGVVESSLVYGEFDIHCKLSVESMEKLKEALEKVRKLRILTSQTLIAYERAPRKVGSVRNRHVRKLGHRRARH